MEKDFVKSIPKTIRFTDLVKGNILCLAATAGLGVSIYLTKVAITSYFEWRSIQNENQDPT